MKYGTTKTKFVVIWTDPSKRAVKLHNPDRVRRADVGYARRWEGKRTFPDEEQARHFALHLEMDGFISRIDKIITTVYPW